MGETGTTLTEARERDAKRQRFARMSRECSVVHYEASHFASEAQSSRRATLGVAGDFARWSHGPGSVQAMDVSWKLFSKKYVATA